MKTYMVERQIRPRQRFSVIAGGLTLSQGFERLTAAAKRAVGEWNRSINALRLVDSRGFVLQTMDRAEILRCVQREANAGESANRTSQIANESGEAAA